MSYQPSLNSSVKDIISNAVQSGSLPASTGSIGGVATSSSMVPPVFTSPQRGLTRSSQIPGAPVKASQGLGSGSMGLNGLFGSQNNSVKPTNLFGSQQSSYQSPSTSTGPLKTPNTPLKASQGLGSGSMGMNGLFGSQNNSNQQVSNSPQTSSSSLGSSNSLQPTKLFGSQNNSAQQVSNSPQASDSREMGSGSMGMNSLFGSQNNPSQQVSSVKPSQNLGSGSMGMNGLFGSQNNSNQPQVSSVKPSQSMGSGSMGMNGLFGSQNNATPALVTPVKPSQNTGSNLFGSQNNATSVKPSQSMGSGSMGMNGLFGSQNNTTSVPDTSVKPSQSMGSGSMGMNGLFGSQNNPPQVKPSQNMGSGSMGMNSLFGSQNNSTQAQNSMNSKISSLRRLSQSQPASQSLEEIEASQPVEVPSSTTSSLSVKDKLAQLRSKSPSNNTPSFASPTNQSSNISIKDKLAQLRSKSSSLSNVSQRASSPPKSVSSSMSQLDNIKSSHTEEQFKVDNVVNMETSNSMPKVTDHEDPLASHMKVFLEYGITIDKVIPDHEDHTFFIHAFTRGGANFVVEVKQRNGATLYLNDGTILEKHEGKEFDLNSKLLNSECEKLGTCGFFAQEGNKVVVSGKEGKPNKRSYILSTSSSDRSLTDDSNIVALPIIEFEQLEADVATVHAVLDYVERQYVNYCFSAAEETYRVSLESREKLIAMLRIIDTHNLEYAVSYDNFRFWEKKKTNEFLSQVTKEGIISSANERKVLFDDLKSTIECGRSLDKIMMHCSNNIHACEERLNSLRIAGSKYTH
jgi:hypothetical protein